MKEETDCREFNVKPIGIIRSPFKEPKGTPIQPRFSNDAEGSIEIFEEYLPGLRDLEGFERIWLIFWFHLSSGYSLDVIPYLETEKRGLFATRAPRRPNPIGISCVRLKAVDGNILTVAELDIVDGTPLLDIKPYSPRFDCYETDRIGWLGDIEERNIKDDGRFTKEKA
jgi:tRNA-Thr(GGU) m(6)t(6)A37 methyltransferase TsaA